MIAAGGTGGHIYPGLALASAIRRQRPNAAITFVGTKRGLEQRIVPAEGYPLALVGMVPFTGRYRAIFPAALLRAGVQANRVLRHEQASVAVGMGGYASAPLILGAWMGRVPSLVHESGAIPGKANLLTARLATEIALAYEEARSAFPRGERARVVGMPLDETKTTLDRHARRPAARRALGLPADAFVVFVTGGSQGAASLNNAAVGLGARWRERDDLRVLLKAGATHVEQVEKELAANGGAAAVRCVSYIEHIEDAYAAADLAISRAGAGSVAEVAVIGLPTIFVPYPFATDDHQTINAKGLVEAGGALLVNDADATADHLGPIIERLAADPDELTRMETAARAVARPRAADDLAAMVLELAGEGRVAA
ncbi:MAG: UDP-N-acetylglucosamine--N-acetylmuramyl-(pentapeptide) pyrophosphoryl-undecaprenol [Actinomycetota bacterium]|nr:UDP-N-acetylglucosamine--N-acetylmuramyl-(pentapeptide) pyrophosphoryl-undecaprenol [Actinomycetota bacterium]